MHLILDGLINKEDILNAISSLLDRIDNFDKINLNGLIEHSTAIFCSKGHQDPIPCLSLNQIEQLNKQRVGRSEEDNEKEKKTLSLFFINWSYTNQLDESLGIYLINFLKYSKLIISTQNPALY